MAAARAPLPGARLRGARLSAASGGAPPAPATDLGWLRLWMDALFARDARGRVKGWNAVAPSEPPPRLFLGATRLGWLWALRADLPEGLAGELARLAGAERPPPAPGAHPERLPRLRELLEAHASARELRQRAAFRFPAELPAPEGVVQVTPDQVDLLGGAFAELRPALAAGPPAYAALEAGEPRALAGSATRAGPAVEAWVYTLPGHRGRGHGARALAAWARALRASGAEPLASAEWSDRSARALARRLGLVRYASGLELR